MSKDDIARCSGDPLDAVQGLQIHRPGAIQHHEPSINEIAMSIAQRGDLAAVEAVERLFRLQVEKDAIQAEKAYRAAMARLAKILPVVDRNGRVKYESKDPNKPGMDRTYGKYEDIDEAIRPIYTDEGFSVAWKTKEGANGKIRMVGICSHCEGHTEEHEIDLPHDSSGGKNPIQAIGSSVLGYGRRMLTTMIFNVRIAGADTDGEDPTPISVEKVSYLERLMAESQTSEKAFEIISGVKTLAEITERDYQRCKTALETKLRAKK
jgi:hypothetical protein